MSSRLGSRQKKVRITPRAKEDLRSIWHYTSDVWTDAQADRYITQIYRRFEWLAQHPQAGRVRADIHPEYRCYPQDSHLVFYRINGNYIDILGVPHKEMDVLMYFD